MSMREKMARAMYNRLHEANDGGGWGSAWVETDPVSLLSVGLDGDFDLEALADAALYALEIPAPDMKMAGAQAITADHMQKAANYDAVCDAWSAMIRKAKEG